MKRSFKHTMLEPYTLTLTDFSARKVYQPHAQAAQSAPELHQKRIRQENSASRHVTPRDVDGATKLLQAYLR